MLGRVAAQLKSVDKNAANNIGDLTCIWLWTRANFFWTCSARPSTRPRLQSACPRICRRARRDAPSSSAPARPRARWRRRSRITGPGRSRVSSSRAMAMARRAAGSKSSKRAIRCRIRPGARRPNASSLSVQGLTADDLVLCLISGGGSALLALAGAGRHARRQAGHQQGPAEKRRDHLGDELRPQASLGDQGRPARRRGRARARRRAIDFRCSGRRSERHRARGRTVADPTTSADALAIIDKYARSPRRRMCGPILQFGGSPKRLKPGDPRLAGVAQYDHRDAAKCRSQAAAAVAEARGRHAAGSRQ